MRDKYEKPKNEGVFLARGIFRTFVRDIKTTAMGVALGAIFGFIGAYFLGFSALSGAKIGALVGAFLALLASSLSSKLFDYDQQAPDRESDS